MKKCPFCAEEIQEAAMKCRFCGEFLVKAKAAGPWYFKTSILVVTFLMVGPLALPLMWLNPRFSIVLKLIATLIICVASYYLWIATAQSLVTLKALLEELQAA